MKTIQEIATETRELLSRLRKGQVRIPKTECSNTLWNLRGYLAKDDERVSLDSILDNIAGSSGSMDEISDYFEPTDHSDLNELWKWFISDQSHVRLVEEVIRAYGSVNTVDMYVSISLALRDKEYEIFEAAKAYIMEVFKDQPDDGDEE